MANFYHITMVPDRDADHDEIRARFDLALDWFRYNKYCWIVYSVKDASAWYQRLKEFVKSDGEIVILKIDESDSQGWITKKFWDWYNKLRDDKESHELAVSDNGSE